MQNALTVIVKIKPGEVEALNEFLLGIGEHIRTNPHIPFNRLTTTHFLRWVIFDQDKPQASLLFTSNHDGDWQSYFDSLVDLAGPAMDTIWSKCEGYPGGYAVNNAAAFKVAFRAFIKTHLYPVLVFFVAYPDQTVKELRAFTGLRQQIETLLDRPEIEPFLSLLPALQITEQPRTSGLALLADGALGFVKAIFLKTIGPFALKVLTAGTPPPDAKQPARNVTVPTALTEREAIVQNELTVISDIIPGHTWRLKLTLWAIGFVTQHLGNGKLSNIATIHFARWVIFDNGRRLLFESNYDGTWESYIGDFVDKAAPGLDSVWRNCVDYPPQGAHNIQEFKESIRDHQHRAQLFYSAYPDQAVKNLRNDIFIGSAIKKLISRSAVFEWLRKF